MQVFILLIVVGFNIECLSQLRYDNTMWLSDKWKSNINITS